MHAENRMGGKICMMLLIEVWSECRDNTSRMNFKNVVETLLNTGVFGIEHSAAQ